MSLFWVSVRTSLFWVFSTKPFGLRFLLGLCPGLRAGPGTGMYVYIYIFILTFLFLLNLITHNSSWLVQLLAARPVVRPVDKPGGS